MTDTSTFLINKRLEAVDPITLLKSRFALREKFFTAKEGSQSEDVPLVPIGQFMPGIAYASAEKNKPSWHLPHYALKLENGQYTTRLKLNPADDDPNTPVGSLSIDLETMPAPDSDPSSRPIPHSLVLKLGFQLPLESEADVGIASTDPTDLSGEWENLDSDATGIVALAIKPNGDDELIVSASENRPPKRVHLGTEIAQLTNGKAMVIFRSEGRSVALHIQRRGDQLLVAEHSDFDSPNASKDLLQEHAFLPRGQLTDRPVIWMPLQDPHTVSSTLRRSVTSIQTREDYARILAVMTDPVHAARLQIECIATVGQRSIRQAFVGHLAANDFVKATGKKSFVLEAAQAHILRDQIASAVIAKPEDLARFESFIELSKPPVPPPPPPPPPSPPTRVATRNHVFDHAGATVFDSNVLARILRTNTSGMTSEFRRNARAGTAAPRKVEKSPELAKLNQSERAKIDTARTINAAHLASRNANAASLNRATAHHAAAAKFKFSEVAKAVIVDAKVPRHVLVEPTGEPVLTRREDRAIQTVAPFVFDRALNPDMFDMPEGNTDGLVLLAHEVTAGGRRTIFYQEGLDSQQYYFEPEEFRLARDDTAPFAPSILFHLSEVIDTSDAEAQPDGEGDISFAVTLAYHAVPYLSPNLLNAARAEFGPAARFVPVAPTIRSLTLSLPGEGGAVPVVLREDAVVDFTDGISDIINLTEDQYQLFVRALQTNVGVGLEGQVDLILMDGSETSVPVRIGLRDNADFAFDQALETVTSAEAKLTLRNRIESPVRVDQAHVVGLESGGTATPAGLGPGTAVAPGDTLELNYAIEPAGTSTSSFNAKIDASVMPDILAILSQTTITQGYSDRNFTIELSVDTAFFGTASDDTNALTGIEVRFRTRDEAVVLTAASPRQSVTLPMPLLLFMTNAAEAEHYSYSVTDLHGDTRGASTAYTAGSGNLEVIPATSSSDFGSGFG